MNMTDELSALIDSWLAQRKNHSLPQLRLFSGLSYATVRRVYQKEGIPTFDTVVSLLGVVANHENSVDFLSRYFPDIGKKVDLSLLAPTAATSLAQLDFMSTTDLLVLSLAAVSGGVREEEITASAGELGMESLNKLMDCGSIEFAGERYRTVENRILGPARQLEAISNLGAMFNYSRINSRGSLIRFKTMNLRKSAVLEVYKILYEANQAIPEISDNPRNQGEFLLGQGTISTFLKFPKGEADL